MQVDYITVLITGGRAGEVEVIHAGRESHLWHINRIPETDDMPPSEWVFKHAVDKLLCLVNALEVTVLMTIRRTDCAVLEFPFIPIGDLMISEPLYICTTEKHPDEFLKRHLGIYLLTSQYRKVLFDITEIEILVLYRICADTGAVAFIYTFFQYSFKCTGIRILKVIFICLCDVP